VLFSFCISQNGGLTAIAFYNPFDVASRQQIGSNHESPGQQCEGDVTVVFIGQVGE
jgi:hypothetical protein